MHTTTKPKPKLERHVFTTSRRIEFTSRKELEQQTGHSASQWLLVVAKELADNAADVTEEIGIPPVIDFRVTTAKGRGQVRVADNGPGIKPDTVISILDFNSRTSSREAYVSPTRGAQGNALKTLIAMPHILGSGADGVTTIEARGIRHTIKFSVDTVNSREIVTHEQTAIGETIGTSVTLHWPDSACSDLGAQKAEFYNFLRGYALFNPHIRIRTHWDGQLYEMRETDPAWVKWKPSDPAPPCWYNVPRFTRLLAAYAHEDASRTVRQFVSEFRGLSGSAKVAEVLDQTDLARVTCGELFHNGKPTKRINRLLEVMQSRANAVKPADLGVIGRDHFEQRFARLDGDPETFEYKAIKGIDPDGLPYVIEAAFAYVPTRAKRGRGIHTGINFSAAINNPFRQLGTRGEGLERVLAGQYCESDDPILVAVHFAAPVVTYLDRGKSSIALRGPTNTNIESEESESTDYYLSEVVGDYDVAGDVIRTVKSVTKRWCVQRRRENRDANAEANRDAALRRTRKQTQKAIAWEVMEPAYMSASANDTLPANARQIMYAARREIQERTGEQLKGAYFTQTLLPDYMAEQRPAWADNVVYDERGHFREPHTDKEIGLGTRAVREYIDEFGKPELCEAFKVQVSTRGPSGRFGGVFFVEKEGFDALFEQVQLAERFDLAFMSTKGISVTAARLLADKMCATYKIPLFLLTDFDKAGFSGAATFEQDNRRYTYEHDIKVYRIGLRLADVRALGIEDQAEDVFLKKPPAPERREQMLDAYRANLAANGATEDEIEFLLTPTDAASAAIGKRVELNALASDQLVAFVEGKLRDIHKVRKIVPASKDLDNAYRLFKRGVAIRDLVNVEIRKHTKLRAPNDLAQRVRAYLDTHAEVPWDTAVAIIAGWQTE